jgi:hypothetical protein
VASIAVLDNVALGDGATNDDTSTVGEPSLAWADGNVFVTGNWYASRSVDGGANWAHVDPFTTFPSAAGGFCCDQIAIRDRARGVWIWILQYVQQNGANVFRLAATKDANFAGGGWYYWTIAPTTLDASFTGVWFDYPDAALTADNLFVTFNMYNAAGQWQRAAVMRFPLDTIANAGTLIFNSWTTTNNGSLRLTQGAGSTMYWGSHNNNQQLRLFAWADGQNNISTWDIGVRQWSGTIASNAPNGVNWLGRADPRITGACVGDGRITFMWTAGSDANRPQAYARVVRINEATKQVADEPDIWSSARAWAYPAACSNSAGVIGMTAFYGGVDRAPGHIVGARDDAGGTWSTIYAKLGSDSPVDGKWGDYLTCRAHAPSPDTWVASGFTLEGGTARTNIVARVVHYRLDQQPANWSAWASEGGVLTSDIAVGRNADGRLEAFVRGTDNALWHKWQVAPSGAWSGWVSLGGVLTSNIAVASNADGRLEAFVRGTDNALWHCWQVAPGGAWSGWTSLGGVLTSEIAVGRNADGRLEVFVRGTDNALWHKWQVSAGGGWSGWASRGGVLTSNPTVASNADGRLEAFVRGTDNALWHNWQVTPGGAWSGWVSLGGVLTSDTAVGLNADGRLEAFVRGTDNALWHKWQVTPGGAWSGWASLAGVLTSTIAVARNSTGRLEAFVRGTDNALWHTWQVAPSGAWSGWASEGGVLTSNPSQASNGDGRIEIFVRGTDNALWHKWQTRPL